MSDIRCATCVFWKEDGGIEYSGGPYGWCRRYPPTVVKEPNMGQTQYYPLMHTYEMCGEYLSHPKRL